jgi:hypothetical protein
MSRFFVEERVREAHFHYCAMKDCSIPEVEKNNRPPIFHSQKEAIKKGWILTTDEKYTGPEEETAWLCPQCVKRIKDQNGII